MAQVPFTKAHGCGNDFLIVAEEPARLAPLDGFRVWVGLLPEELARPIAQTERYGILILMGLFFVAPLIGIDFFGWVVRPRVEGLASGLTGE